MINFVFFKLLQVYKRGQKIVKEATSWYQHSKCKIVSNVPLIVVLTIRGSIVITYLYLLCHQGGEAINRTREKIEWRKKKIDFFENLLVKKWFITHGE